MKFANIDMSLPTNVLASGDIVSFGLGDFLQAQTISYLYQYMGVPKEEIQWIRNSELQTYAGEPVLLPINMYAGWPSLPSGGLFSPNIYPVFCGVSFPEELPPKSVEWLKQWEPIGCRDEATYRYLKEQGVDSFLSGCMTIALPKRKEPSGSKVFFVDAPDDVLQYVPESLLQKIVFRNNFFIGSYSAILPQSQDQYARQNYQELAQDAALVVTTRLHVAAPCIAMGIPTIFCAGEVVSSRFSWIDKYIPIYAKGEYDKINWDPPCDLITETEKDMILKTAAEQVWWKYCEYQHQNSRDKITAHYLNRKKTKTCTRKEQIPLIVSDVLKKHSGEEPFRYALWGLHYRARWIYDAIQEQCPSAELTAVYDTYKTGEYLGHTIMHPDEIKKHCGGVFHFVCAIGACAPAKELFDKIGLSNSSYCLMEEEFQRIASGHSLF